MKRIASGFISASAILCLSPMLNAAPLYYDCKVDNAYTTSAKGALEAVAKNHELIGTSFHVTRLTGEISGTLIHNRGANSIRVAHRGTDKAPFKTVTEYTGKVHLLVVDETAKGDSKPFMVNTGDGLVVATGICK